MGRTLRGSLGCDGSSIPRSYRKTAGIQARRLGIALSMAVGIDKTARNQAAMQIIKDETIMASFEAVQKTLVKELLNATTPEDREAKFQEHQGVRRVLNTLQSWAGSEVIRRNQENQK